MTSVRIFLYVSPYLRIRISISKYLRDDNESTLEQIESRVTDVSARETLRHGTFNQIGSCLIRRSTFLRRKNAAHPLAMKYLKDRYVN